MELLLNLTWLVVVFLLFVGTWRGRVSSTESRSWKTVAVVIACIAMLLFPAVSLSDDLHVECVAVESSGKRAYQLMLDTLQMSAALVVFASTVIAAIIALLLRKAVANTADIFLQNPLDGFRFQFVGRAPPRTHPSFAA